jgi:hypothetical protein
MSGPYMLHGVVSWQSIAPANLRGQCETLADVTDDPHEVGINAELLVPSRTSASTTACSSATPTRRSPVW